MITITHTNFDRAMQLVKEGKQRFVIPTYTRTTVIDHKTVARFEKAGYAVISKDSDGKGFRMQSGKRRDYVFAGQLLMVE